MSDEAPVEISEAGASLAPKGMPMHERAAYDRAAFAVLIREARPEVLALARQRGELAAAWVRPKPSERRR